MFKKLILCTLFILGAGGVFFLGAQEEPPAPKPDIQMNQRSFGNQAVAISPGLFVPLFTVLLNDRPDNNRTKGSYPSQFSLGGAGVLGYRVYLSPNINVGLQISGSFANDINSNYAYVVPIVVVGKYDFHLSGRFTIPVSLGIGISMTTWKENFRVDPILRPGIGFYFDWSFEWSFGINVNYWFIIQTSFSDPAERSLFNALDVSITAEYHF